MSGNRLSDYPDHIRQAAADARGFVDGLSREDFLADKRTQNAVIMSLIIVGEAATTVMDDCAEFAEAHPEVPWRGIAICAIAWPTATSTSTSTWCGPLYRNGCRY